MSLIVPRTCTELHAADEDQPRERDSRPLASYRDVPAYVLLGDPGAGKTTAFRTECEALGAEALSITARDFTTFDPDHHPEWEGKTLFIDGLDEIRVGAVSARAPFDEIRARLDKLGRPRFRLSCRHADWLGPNDRRHLVSVSPQEAQVTVLGLDPLSETQVAQIVDARTRIDDVNEFILKARETGIADLLENPQALLLLADVIDREGAWPTSRLDLFDKACALTIKETNEEHSIAPHRPPTPELLDAAGRLCAVLLVSGAVGYVRGQRHACDDYLKPEQCEYPSRDLLERALATKLFTAANEGHFIPVHRHIAEFLGAKHLSALIEKRLPAGRAIALLTGYDGGVVTNLRGLTAWLAALCESARRELIGRDPIGVVSYGDVVGFTVQEKRLLLEAIGNESSRIYSQEWTGWAIGAVATPGMEPVLGTLLEAHDEAEYELIQLVLLSLQHGAPLPGMCAPLLKMVYDENCVLNHSWMALEAFIHNCTDDGDVTRILQLILKAISNGTLTDVGKNLTAIALTHLYPCVVSASDIWDHLTEPPHRHTGRYRRFWGVNLIDRSSEHDFETLLDGLVAGRGHLKSAIESLYLQEVPVKLLARGLEACHERLNVKRLFSWLRVVIPEWHRHAPQDGQRIRTWLEERPEVQKQLVQEYVTSHHGAFDSLAEHLLHGARFPRDFGLWCLDRAAVSKSHAAIRYYLRYACRALEDEGYDRGLSLEVLIELARDHDLLEHLAPFLRCPWSKPERKSYRRESDRRRREFAAVVASHRDALLQNCSPARLLHHLARTYFGLSSDVRGEDPRKRLDDLFDNNRDLTCAALVGLRLTPLRDDIPGPHDIFKSTITNEEYLIALPFLAGLEVTEDLNQLNDRQLRQAYAFQFCTLTNGTDRDREQRLLQTAPRIAAEVLVQCVRAKMGDGVYGDRIAERLSADEYAMVARHAALPLLGSFPVCCGQPQGLAMLDELLRAAILYEKTAALTLIDEKLSRTTMRDPQRVHWLASAAGADPDRYLGRLQEFVGHNERRVSTLENFICRYHAQPADQQPTPMLEWLIQRFGSAAARSESAASTHPSLRDPSSQVHAMVRALADRPDCPASDALAKLVSNESLQPWRSYLTEALERQRVLRRDAEYRHPTVTEACTTLNDGTPSNAGDLAALLTHRLLVLSRRIRDDTTDDWRQYWNVDRYGKPLQPRPENVCRDALLSGLKPLLPVSVRARREGSYANDKRADIVVEHGDFEVPVEIKRNGHQNLWSAAHDQLIAKYTNAPATDGYGIYLVFWFGKDDTQPAPTGPLPADPDELRTRLAETLSDAEQRKISIVVIDVSRPA